MFAPCGGLAVAVAFRSFCGFVASFRSFLRLLFSGWMPFVVWPVPLFLRSRSASGNDVELGGSSGLAVSLSGFSGLFREVALLDLFSVIPGSFGRLFRSFQPFLRDFPRVLRLLRAIPPLGPLQAFLRYFSVSRLFPCFFSRRLSSPALFQPFSGLLPVFFQSSSSSSLSTLSAPSLPLCSSAPQLTGSPGPGLRGGFHQACSSNLGFRISE